MKPHVDPLCKTCQNKEREMVFVGHRVMERELCFLDKASYPIAVVCQDYIPKEKTHED
jgi:hypothetical protein